jgi:TolB-like protein/predicted Zn-dependent protease
VAETPQAKVESLTDPRSPQRWAEVERLLDQALDLAPEDRPAFLERTSSSDPVLGAEVARLLRATEAAESFIGVPAPAYAAPLVAWAAERPAVAPGMRFGVYEVVRLLGRGGMATVYLAQDHKHHRPVAIKVLHPELAAAVGAEWFLREIEIAAALHHPHILPLHDSGAADGLLYYVMPYVEGESLRQRLMREGHLPIEDAIRIVQEVAGALDHAHRQGVVHRDIKPENILLQDGQAIVADFGIARAIDAAGADRLTKPGPGIGTPAYMSPEQACSDAVIDGRADIYALGCVLYEMLTGQPPFSGDSAQDILTRHADDPVPSLHPTRQAVPPAVERAVTRALAKVPADRFPTARAFAEALAAAPSTAPAPGGGAPVVVSQAPRGASRRRRWRMAAGVGLMILAGGLAATLARKPLELKASRVLVGLLGPAGSHQGGDGSAGQSAPTADALAAENLRSIAVLPLVNLSPVKEDEYFSDGMTDELISALGKVEGLRVAARVSAFAFKGKPVDPREVSEKLHVGTVLDGSVRKAGNRLRVSVELVSTRDGSRLWFDSYDRTLTDVFTVQEEVARAITGALKLKLATPAGTPVVMRPTDDLQAYDLYLKGRYYSYRFAEGARPRAIEYFRKAVERDSSYALAWAGLADGYGLMTDVLPPQEIPALREKARAAALQAVTLDSTLAEAYAALGDIQYWFDWNWEPAEQSLRHAIALNPNYPLAHRWYSELLTMLRRYPEAVAEAERAEQLDPLNPFMVLGTWGADISARQYKRADEAARRWLELDSTSALAYNALGWAQLWEGSQNEALANLGKAAKLAPDAVLQLRLAYAYVATGRREKARRILSRVERLTLSDPPLSTEVAGVHAALGDLNGALGWLERGYVAHDWSVTLMAGLPYLDPLRGDPRFSRLLRLMRLPT